MNTKCYECGKVMKKKEISYHYTESGLRNVYLDGVFEFTCSKCGASFVDIPEPVQLHIVLAIVLSCLKKRLTGPEIRFMRQEVGMTSKAFAEMIGVSPVTMSRWENDEGDANKDESNDRLIRMAFKVMMCERLHSIISSLENMIQRAQVISIHNERLDVNADAMKFISIPGEGTLVQQSEC